MSDQQPRGGVDWRRLHLWEIQPVRDLALLALIVGVVYIGYLVRVVTVPLLLALLLAYLFEPLVRWLGTRRLASRRWAALGLIAAFTGFIVVPLSIGAGFGVVQGVKAAGVLAKNAGAVQKSIAAPEDEALRDKVPTGAWREIRDFLAVPPEDADAGVGFAAMRSETREDLRVLARRVVDYAGEHAGELARWGGTRVLGGGAQAVGAALDTLVSVGAVLFTIGLTAFFFYFFCTGWGKVLEFWEELIPERRRGRTVEIVRQMDRVIAGFVRGRLTICFILSVYMTIAYWLVGVPAPLILGPVIGMLFIVPYVHAVGMPVAMLMMWLSTGGGGAGAGLTSHWWWIVGAPVGVYIIAQLLDDWVLSPLIQGKTTDLPIPTILFASLAGGALAGIYGLLIAIPIAACIRILLNEVFWPRFRQWARGERPDFLPIGQGPAPAEPRRGPTGS